jgi:hypothetical protein
MLRAQVLVNLFAQICVGMDLVNHNHGGVCVYLGAAAIALVSKIIGQAVMNTITLKATSSDT